MSTDFSTQYTSSPGLPSSYTRYSTNGTKLSTVNIPGVGSGQITITSVTTPQAEGTATQTNSSPTAILDAPSKFQVTSLRYPYDIGTNTSQQHWVQISVRQVTPGGYNSGDPYNNVTTGAKSLEIAEETLTNGLNALKESSAGQAVINSNGGQAVINSNFYKQVKEDLAVGGALVQTSARTGLTVKPPTNQATAIITLYMPDTLTAQYNADYTKIDLRTDMGSTLRKIQTIESIADTALKKPGAGLKEILGNEVRNPAVLERIFNVSKRVGATQGFSDVLLQGQGYTVNPQMQMLYQGLGFRTFSLSFIFTPTSKGETALVDDIISTLKQAAAPSLNDATQSSTKNMFLIPPDIFNISFCWRGVENKYLPKYGDCVLENIDVNYAPNGWAAHDENGSPVQTTLNLTFKEIEIVTRERLLIGQYRSNPGHTGLR